MRPSPPGTASIGTTSPALRVASSAARCSAAVARAISRRASLTGFPTSWTIKEAKCSARAARSSAARCNSAARRWRGQLAIICAPSLACSREGAQIMASWPLPRPAALHLAAEEATRIAGEVVPMDAVPGGEGRIAYTVRRPLGIIAGITGFNFPLLLDCHKIAPALAAGNAIVLKPAPETPITALELAAVFAEAGVPRGALSVLTGDDGIGEQLVRDERVAMITFTGSSAVGKHIRSVAGYKRVTLELGNNSPLIIEADADLERAAARTVAGGYYAVGQACIAVQRIYAQRSICQEFAQRLALQVGKLRTGDPRDPATDSSTLVSEQATQRVMAVLRDAQERGAQLRVGGELLSDGCITPAVLLGVTPSMQICKGELFGPAVAIAPYDTLDEAIDLANSTPYGLQAGIFTNNLQNAFYAAERLDFGGVHINEVSSYRADHMPYGGVKASGMGREGPRYAIEEMSETKIIIITI